MQPKRRIENLSELPTMPSTIGTMAWNQTGDWRYLSPVFANRPAPCSHACPTGIDTARIEMLIAQGLFKEAWEMILQENPFPGVCGRVCFHPCEAACNRREFDEAIAIHALERFAADMAAGCDFKPQPDLLGARLNAYPERIAIVGAGPSGLAAAWFLARLGYACDLFESKAEAGGILRWGIPIYRLPLSVLQREIAQIEALGPRIHTGKAMDAKTLSELLKSYQGVYVACGHGKTTALGVPGETLPAVRNGLSFLAELREGRQPAVPGLSAVIGGGNTAIDVARSIVRLGGKVLILYRRRLQDMPAFGDEVQMALDEGVELMELVAPASLTPAGDNCRVVLRKMRVAGDDGGRARVEPDGTLTCEVEVARLFRATGAQAADSWIEPPGSGILNLGGCCLVQKKGAPPLVYGGDVTNDVKSVVHAVASGKQAAMALDTLFREGADAVLPKLESCRVGDGAALSMEIYMGGARSRQSGDAVRYGEINADYFHCSRRMTTPRLERDERVRTFQEIDLQVSPETATQEAKRCFNCGACNQCDNCYLFCPDASVIHDRAIGLRLIDYDYCKGCGICSRECPRGVITMEDIIA